MALRSRQLQLELATRPNWGGARVGAGRKPGASSRDPHRRRAPRSWRRVCKRGRFRLVHYSIQDDHVHMIVEAASGRDLACGLKAIAARLARGVNRVFLRSGRVLADRCHVHVLRTPREVRNAIAYVLLNARRYLAKRGRSLPTIARIDPASSGRWFSGWSTAVPLAHDPPVVAAPRTWLLSIG